MFSASSGVSSMASHTLANLSLLICLAPSISHGNGSRPSPNPACWSSVSSSENSEAHRPHRRTSPRKRLETHQQRPESEFLEHLARLSAWTSSRQALARAELGQSDALPHAALAKGRFAGHQGNYPGIQRTWNQSLI